MYVPGSIVAEAVSFEPMSSGGQFQVRLGIEQLLYE